MKNWLLQTSTKLAIGAAILCGVTYFFPAYGSLALGVLSALGMYVDDKLITK